MSKVLNLLYPNGGHNLQVLGISKAIICIEIIILCMHFCSGVGCPGYIFVPRAASPRSIFGPRAEP